MENKELVIKTLEEILSKIRSLNNIEMMAMASRKIVEAETLLEDARKHLAFPYKP